MLLSRTLAIRSWGACLIAAVIVIAGCAPQQSTAPPSSAAPVQRPPADLMQIKSELLTAQSQLGTTQDALNVLAKSPRQDLKGKYETFSTQYVRLQTKVSVARSRAYDLKSQATAYDAGRVGNTANEQMNATRFCFNRYMSTVEAIHDFLAGNLSVAGVESLTDLIAKSNAEAQELDGHVTALTAAIDELAAAREKRQGAATGPAARNGT